MIQFDTEALDALYDEIYVASLKEPAHKKKPSFTLHEYTAPEGYHAELGTGYHLDEYERRQHGGRARIKTDKGVYVFETGKWTTKGAALTKLRKALKQLAMVTDLKANNGVCGKTKG